MTMAYTTEFNRARTDIDKPAHTAASQRSPTPLFVFVHGFLGFVQLPMLPFARYFKGIEGAFRSHGYATCFPRLPPAESVERRAAVLADRLRPHAGRPLIVMAHSMGGLDARQLAARHGGDVDISAVVSFGTPHHGTPVAEWALAGDLPYPLSLARRFRPALLDMTRQACARRNDDLPDRPGVTYLSCIGTRPAAEMRRPLAQLADRMADEVGESDGLVPAGSARWGIVQDPLAADHLELVGWNAGPWLWPRRAGFAHIDLYLGLAEQLTDGLA